MVLCYSDMDRIWSFQVVGSAQSCCHSVGFVGHVKPEQVDKEQFILCLQTGIGEPEWPDQSFEFDERRNAELSVRQSRNCTANLCSVCGMLLYQIDDDAAIKVDFGRIYSHASRSS